MSRRLFCLFLALAWLNASLPFEASAAVVRAASAAAKSPLAMAGGMIDASLPGLSSGNLLVPSWSNGSLSLIAPDLQDLKAPPLLQGQAVPSLLDPRRAAVLADRAMAADSPAMAEAAALKGVSEAVSAEPTAILERVNSVLKDFTPEDLQKLSDEDLSSLSSVVMDGLAGFKAGKREYHQGMATLARVRTEKLLAKRGQELDKYEPYKAVKDMQAVPVYIHGTSERVKTVRPKAEEGVASKQDLTSPRAVFRHYTTKEGLEAILSSKALLNGYLPYIELIVYVARYIYEDLSGVFLTVPEASGRDVGVPPEQRYYVDLELPKGFSLIQPDPIYPIFLVPLPGRTRGWIADAYRKWMKGEDLSPEQEAQAKRLDQEGGPGPDLALPIKVVGHGEVK
ncbi:MAG: hypothetical protein HY924_02110 [Elusimicrobia bacterium]|nr:hypothetical protein [Elusimicrobiota bacterium]